MNKKTLNTLLKKYKFLRELKKIECGDGWKLLITNMCKELKSANPPNDFIITKIGERYGGLDVHTKNGVMRTRVIVDEFNTTSIELCHDCGNDRALEKCGTCTEPIIEYPDPDEDTDDDDDNTACISGCVPGSGACSSCP